MLLTFMHRRFLRIMPTLLLWVPIFSLISYFIYPHWVEKTTLITGLASFFGLSNLFLVYSSLDYFSPGAISNIFLHLWTISVEDQFYIAFALLSYLISRYYKRKFSGFTICIVFLTFCLIGIIKGPASSYVDFYLLHTRFYEFILGGSSYIAGSQGFFKIVNKTIIDIICLTIILLFCFNITEQSITNFDYVIFCISSCILLYPCDKSVVRSFLSLKIFCRIGAISYSLYVIHLPITRLLGLFYDLTFSHYIVFISYIIITIALSVTNYYLIELKYFKKYRFNLLRPAN